MQNTSESTIQYQNNCSIIICLIYLGAMLLSVHYAPWEECTKSVSFITGASLNDTLSSIDQPMVIFLFDVIFYGISAAFYAISYPFGAMEELKNINALMFGDDLITLMIMIILTGLSFYLCQLGATVIYDKVHKVSNGRVRDYLDMFFIENIVSYVSLLLPYLIIQFFVSAFSELEYSINLLTGILYFVIIIVAFIVLIAVSIYYLIYFIFIFIAALPCFICVDYFPNSEILGIAAVAITILLSIVVVGYVWHFISSKVLKLSLIIVAMLCALAVENIKDEF